MTRLSTSRIIRGTAPGNRCSATHQTVGFGNVITRKVIYMAAVHLRFAISQILMQAQRISSNQ